MSPNVEAKIERARFVEVAGLPPRDRLALDCPPRAARLPRFMGMAAGALDRFDQLDIAVIGAGSVGGRIALEAARLQPGTLRIVDPGRFKAESLLTHDIPPGAIGEPKAWSAGQAAKAISPATRVLACEGRIQDLSPAAFAPCTLGVLATDNLNAEVAAAQLSLHHGFPLVQGSVHGESLTAQARFFANREAAGPCAGCGFGPAEMDLLSRQAVFSCAGGEAGPDTGVLPTMSTGFLCSLAADLVLTQVIRHLLGLGAPVADTLVHWSGYTHAMRVLRLERNQQCPCEHLAWTRVPAPAPVARSTLGSIARAAGREVTARSRDVAFSVDDLSYFAAATCCGEAQSVRRFSAAGGDLGRCRRCAAPLWGGAFHGLRTVPASGVDLEVTLDELGAGAAEFVVVHYGERCFFVS